MTSFFVRRALMLAATIWLAVTVLFVLLHVSPASPLNNLPPQIVADPAAKAAIMAEKGLDRPLPVQYLSYWGGLLTGDLGKSLYDGSSVAGMIATSAPVSLELGGIATLLAVGAGGAVGIASARAQGKRGDALARFSTVLAISVPSYWLAVISLVVVGNRYPNLLPSAGGFRSLGADPAANLRSLILPSVILSLSGFAMVARALRSALIEAYESDEVRFARAMGMSESHILWRIAMKSAAPATITVVGLVAGIMLSGTVLIENVFQLPGMGQLMVMGFGLNDYDLALGTAIVTAIIFLSLNLAVDIALHFLDPRLRQRIGEKRPRKSHPAPVTA
ncbi:MAG: ABC transporter permease [Acidimicrobiia bacterium]